MIPPTRIYSSFHLPSQRIGGQYVYVTPVTIAYLQFLLQFRVPFGIATFDVVDGLLLLFEKAGYHFLRLHTAFGFILQQLCCLQQVLERKLTRYTENTK